MKCKIAMQRIGLNCARRGSTGLYDCHFLVNTNIHQAYYPRLGTDVAGKWYSGELSFSETTMCQVWY